MSVPPYLAPLAATCGAALASSGFGLLALWRAKALISLAERKRAEGVPSADAAIGVLQQKMDELQQQVDDLRRASAPAPVFPGPRGGLNLDKRSQALRMHRRGESPKQIAELLEIPLQEVNLLLKVHRIVLRSI